MDKESEKKVSSSWVSKYITHNVLTFIFNNILNGLLIGLGIWMSSFVLLVIGLISPCRQLGWALSKRFLYHAPLLVTITTCLTWGVVAARGVHELIIWLEPSLLIKIIFGWGAGAYVSIPNFGLFNEQAIPDHAKPRHALIEVLPFLTYALTSILFAWFP